MTEPIPQLTGTTKKKRSLFVPLTVVIVTIAVMGFLASRAGLDKALVKQVVDQFIVQMKEKARNQGRDLDVTYGQLEVVGSFASKHVVIHDPVVTIKPLSPKPQSMDGSKRVDDLQITTPTIEIYAESNDLSNMRIQAPAPIDFAGLEEPEKSLLKITNNVPMVWKIGTEKHEGVPYRKVSYESPTQTELTYLREQQASGVEDESPTLVPVYQTLEVKAAQGSGFSSSMAIDGSGLGESNVAFRDVLLTPKEAPEGALKVAEITGRWSNQFNEKKQNAVAASFTFGPVTSDNKAAPYVPVTLDMDATYEGIMGKSASPTAQESSMVLKKLSLTTKEASLTATANFNANALDVLPVGTANIALSNVPFVFSELHKYGMLNEKTQETVTKLLEQITGKPMGELKDIAIPVERVRGGAFKIGNTTFEELLASLIGQAIRIKPSQAPSVTVPESESAPKLVPHLPPPDKPKSTPIEVPDSSVRG